MFTRTADLIDHFHRLLRQNLAAYMTAKGWSARRLAEETGVPHTTVMTVLSGKASIEQAQRLDRALPSAWTMELDHSELGYAISLIRRPARSIETWLSQNGTGYFLRDRLELKDLKDQEIRPVLDAWLKEAVDGLPVWTEAWQQRADTMNNASMADVRNPDPLTYRILRFSPTAQHHVGANKQGTTFGDDPFTLYGESVAFDYQRCKREGLPMFNIIAYQNYDKDDGRFYERLLLPFRMEDDPCPTVGRVFSLIRILGSFSRDRPNLR